MFTNPRFPFIVDKKAANREARRHLETLGSDIEPKSKVGSLSVGERQIVEIARALAMGSEIVILDEPTSSLSFKEKETLFKVVGSLKREGKAIIYITHFLEEVLELCDKFVVLRNGQLHGQGAIKDVTNDDIVRLIIGRNIAVESASQREVKGDVALKVEKIRSPQFSEDISFELRRGEILGLWGLMGSGRTELVRAILGLDPIEGGSLFLAMDGVDGKNSTAQTLEPLRLHYRESTCRRVVPLSAGVEKYYRDRARKICFKSPAISERGGRAESVEGAHRILTDSSGAGTLFASGDLERRQPAESHFRQMAQSATEDSRPR